VCGRPACALGCAVGSAGHAVAQHLTDIAHDQKRHEVSDRGTFEHAVLALDSLVDRIGWDVGELPSQLFLRDRQMTGFLVKGHAPACTTSRANGK